MNLEEENKKLKEENELLKQRLNNYSTTYKKYYTPSIDEINSYSCKDKNYGFWPLLLIF